MILNNLIIIRPYNPKTDDNFIYSTMIRGLYYGDSWFSKIPKNLFVQNYRKIIESFILRPTTEIKVACLKSDLEEIKGYSILLNNNHSLMWVFVKKNWRKNRIAKALVPNTIVEVANLTALGEVLLKKYPHLIFNPFA